MAGIVGIPGIHGIAGIADFGGIILIAGIIGIAGIPEILELLDLLDLSELLEFVELLEFKELLEIMELLELLCADARTSPGTAAAATSGKSYCTDELGHRFIWLPLPCSRRVLMSQPEHCAADRSRKGEGGSPTLLSHVQTITIERSAHATERHIIHRTGRRN